MAKGKPKKSNVKEMSPEEKQKAKAEKLEQERLRKIAQMEEEQKALSEKYHREVRESNIRDFMLIDTIKSFDAMRHAHRKVLAEQAIQQKWDDYVNCVNLPMGSDAPDLRAFLHAWQCHLKDEFSAHISWVIDVNERSLLNQDVDSKNMCFKKLWNEQPAVGDCFIRWMRNANRLIHDMEKVIHTTSLPFLKTELIEIREKFRRQLKTTVDLFAYRLLTHIEVDMVRVDTHTAKHNYESELFRSSVWTTRPVPQIDKHWLTERSHHIGFPLFGCSLWCPEAVEIDGYSFRSLWTGYDHYSDTAPSYDLKLQDVPIHDLRAANRVDWTKMQELRAEKLNEMIRVRAEWEETEKLRIAAEEAAKKNKKSVKPGEEKPKKNKKVKVSPEPPPANKDTIVAVDDEFKLFDDEQYTNFLESTSPDSLNLVEDEVNLRSMYMLGGLMEFNYFKRPAQYNQISENMLLRMDDGTILEYIDYKPVYDDNVPDFDRELVEINVKLSNTVCWWITPTVAYWEPWEKSNEFLNLSPELQDFHFNYDKYLENLGARLFSSPSIKIDQNMIKCLNDFRVNDLPHDIGFVEFIKFYLIPRIPLSYKFKSELDQEREQLRKENLRRKEIEMEHEEEKERKRRAFEEEMRVYQEEADAERNAMIDKRRAEMREERELTRLKLINAGENDKQIEKHLKFKETVDEKILSDLNMDELAKYHDYYSQQLDFRFGAGDTSEESIVVHRAFAAKTFPADLYPPYVKQLPLRVSMLEHKSVCFDCPTIEDNAEIEVDENADSDQMLLSTFLQYLKILCIKSLPQFGKHKFLGNRETIVVPPVVAEEVLAQERRSSLLTSKRRSSSIIANLVNAKVKLKKKSGTKKKPVAAKSNNKSLETKNIVMSVENMKPDEANDEQSRTSRAGSIYFESAVTSEKPVRHKLAATNMKLIPNAAGKWMTTGIYFTEFDPTTNFIKFKTSHFGPFGFAMPRYCNYPLKSWEIYPNFPKKNSVVLRIVGNFCEIKFEITEDGYYIENIVPNKINFEPNKVAMTFDVLMNFLSQHGLLNFVKDDAVHYINSVTEKVCALEWHTLKCMAQFTLAYYFMKSEFNAKLDRRSTIFHACQLHEEETLDIKKLEFQEILVTMLRANTVKSEEIPIKNSLEMKLEHRLVPEEQDFFPDLVSLLIDRSHAISIKKYKQMRGTFRHNVANLLCAIRPFSFAA